MDDRTNLKSIHFSMVIEAFKFLTSMKVNNTESAVTQPKPKPVANNSFADRKSSQPQIAPKPIQNLKRSSHGVQNDTELLPKVQKMTKPAVEIKPAPLKETNTEVVQFTYDDKEECSVTSSSNSEKQAVDLEDDDAVEEISIDEIPALTGNESGLIKIETDQFEQLPVSYI